MKEMEEREKQLNYRTAYKNLNSKYTSNKENTLKTIPEGDNENLSKKFTEENDSRSNINYATYKTQNQNQNPNQNYQAPYVNKNYSSSPTGAGGREIPFSSSVDVEASNVSHNRQATDLVYSSDNDEDKPKYHEKYNEIEKKYAHINKDSDLSDYTRENFNKIGEGRNQQSPDSEKNEVRPQKIKGLSSNMYSENEESADYKVTGGLSENELRKSNQSGGGNLRESGDGRKINVKYRK